MKTNKGSIVEPQVDRDEVERKRKIREEELKQKALLDEIEKEKKKKLRDKAKDKIETSIKDKTKKGIWDRYSYRIVFGILGLLFLFAFIGKSPGERRSAREIPVIEQEFIDKVNSEDRGYTVDTNGFFEGWTLHDVKGILANSLTKKKGIPRCPIQEDTLALEKYYFPEKHPNCLSEIQTQLNCSSSFAITTTGIFNDKLCILNNDEKIFVASPQHPLSCDGATSRGCKGGYLVGSMDLGRLAGFVDTDCLPYDIEKVEDCDVEAIKKCKRHKVKDYCVLEGMEDIKRSLNSVGPVAALIHVTREFLLYKDGIYDESFGEGKLEGAHGVKIVGWDSMDGIDYWIIENSWGPDWGKEGYAFVKMGVTDSFLDKVALTVNPIVDEDGKEEAAAPEQEQSFS